MLYACSPARFIPEGETRLASVRMTSDEKEVAVKDYRRFVRQEANAKWLGFMQVPLGIYCISGTDSTKKFNKFVRRIGEAPVIYDQKLTEFTCNSIHSTLQSHGYMQARVEADTVHLKRKKTRLTYHLHPGKRSYVTNWNYVFDCDTLKERVMSPDFQQDTKLYKGMPFDITIFDEERKRIIRKLQNEGYYALNNDFISYRADTLTGDYGIDMTMVFKLPQNANRQRSYQKYHFRHVNIYEGNDRIDSCKTQISRRVYGRHTNMQADSLYRERDVQSTYQSLNGLAAVQYTNVRLREQGDSLDANVYTTLQKRHGLSLSLEGTNTAGDLGAAVSIGYTNNNVFRGAENLSLKLRGAYEAITGLEDYDHQNYIEYGGELSIKFPNFLLPMKEKRRRKINATTELSFLYDSQNRPEFHRRVVTAAWSYNWTAHAKPQLRHRLDLLSLNYLFMPWISETFRKNYLDNTTSKHSILRYSYEDLFIMKFGYSFVYNSLRGTPTLYHTNGYQVRFNAETSGNLLYGIAKAAKLPKDDEGQSKVFNIPFSQYVKVDLDAAKSFILSDRSSIAIHGAFGIAIPYGNSSMIPYEKRYFSGGANSVRGWSVRELGPGSYTGQDGKVDFINQTGNIKLDLSVEYRVFLFWKFHGAVFVDAGNIWNTRDYDGLEKGTFHFKSFYKQIAVSYGLGLRLNFNYFILRLDGGMKAINPAYESGKLHYPIIHPKFKRDFAWHFAVGLPF